MKIKIMMALALFMGGMTLPMIEEAEADTTYYLERIYQNKEIFKPYNRAKFGKVRWFNGECEEIGFARPLFQAQNLNQPLTRKKCFELMRMPEPDPQRRAIANSYKLKNVTIKTGPLGDDLDTYHTYVRSIETMYKHLWFKDYYEKKLAVATTTKKKRVWGKMLRNRRAMIANLEETISDLKDILMLSPGIKPHCFSNGTYTGHGKSAVIDQYPAEGNSTQCQTAVQKSALCRNGSFIPSTGFVLEASECKAYDCQIGDLSLFEGEMASYPLFPDVGTTAECNTSSEQTLTCTDGEMVPEAGFVFAADQCEIPQCIFNDLPYYSGETFLADLYPSVGSTSQCAVSYQETLTCFDGEVVVPVGYVTSPDLCQNPIFDAPDVEVPNLFGSCNIGGQVLEHGESVEGSALAVSVSSIGPEQLFCTQQDYYARCEHGAQVGTYVADAAGCENEGQALSCNFGFSLVDGTCVKGDPVSPQMCNILRTTHESNGFWPECSGGDESTACEDQNAADEALFRSWYPECPTSSPHVSPNEAPEFGSDSISINSNEFIVDVSKVTASDPEQEQLTYTLTGGADENQFEMDIFGNLKFKSVQVGLDDRGNPLYSAIPYFDTPRDADQDNIYDIIVTATDPHGLSDTASISISIQKVTVPTRIYCGGPGDSCYDNAEAMAAEYAMTPGGKKLELIELNNGFKVWKQVNGSYVLSPTGLDFWAMKLNLDGKSQSEQFFGVADLAGRVCPTNVYMGEDDKFATGKCLYYTEAKVQQRLDAGVEVSWNYSIDRPVTQNELYNLGMHSWTEASWYVGNIYSCGLNGMRLPTIYETDASNTQAFLDYPNGSPVFAGESGLASQTNAPTWTATSNASMATDYLTWNSDGGDGFDVGTAAYNSKAAAVICVLPGS